MIPSVRIPADAAVDQDLRGLPIIEAPVIPTVERVHQVAVGAAVAVGLTEDYSHVTVSTAITLEVHLKFKIGVTGSEILEPLPTGGCISLAQLSVRYTPVAGVDGPDWIGVVVTVLEIILNTADTTERAAITPVHLVTGDAVIVAGSAEIHTHQPLAERGGGFIHRCKPGDSRHRWIACRHGGCRCCRMGLTHFVIDRQRNCVSASLIVDMGRVDTLTQGGQPDIIEAGMGPVGGETDTPLLVCGIRVLEQEAFIQVDAISVTAPLHCQIVSDTRPDRER